MRETHPQTPEGVSSLPGSGLAGQLESIILWASLAIVLSDALLDLCGQFAFANVAQPSADVTELRINFFFADGVGNYENYPILFSARSTTGITSATETLTGFPAAS